MLLGVLAFVGIVYGLPLGGGRAQVMVLPAALFGLVAPAVGYRVYHTMRERNPRDEPLRVRCQAFLRAIIVPLAITEGAALLGLVVYMLSRDLVALTGSLTHVLLTGAVWPSRTRLDLFVGNGR